MTSVLNVESVIGNNIEHPSHYNREGAMECIDEMIEIFGKEAVKDFCLCNAWKYRYRAADKNGEEDLKKSDWYMRKFVELQKETGVTTKESIVPSYPIQYINTAPNDIWKFNPPYEVTCNTAQVKTD